MRSTGLRRKSKSTGLLLLCSCFRRAFDITCRYGDHAAIFSFSVAALITIAYAYTSGAFLGPGESHGPTSVRKYFFDTVSFDAAYLRQWGALYGPATKQQAYRLVTYSLIHQT